MNESISNKLKKELDSLNKVCDKLFHERFSTSKRDDRWEDELFKEYQTINIRIKLLMELI